MKLNINPGNNIRVGYMNIATNYENFSPIYKDNPKVNFCDWSKLDALRINNGSCEEICAINAVDRIAIADLGNVLKHWTDKLAPKGTMYLEGLDSNMLGVQLCYEQMPIENINAYLFGTERKGLYNLMGLETFFKSLGLEVVSKGYKGLNFYMTVEKV